ncbi:MAG: glycosyl hydrolase [Prolixibacteraceae bacterium]|jgi:hypothetical protein|nr:glycosyl hydrolase [Prolixibacteraceae bacterium]
MDLKRIVFIISFVLVSCNLFAQFQSAKRGIAYGYHSPEDLDVISSGLSWWYNWYVTPESEVADVYEDYHLEFVPMTWNGSADTAKLKAYLRTHPEVKYILGFNEPNFKTQANMTPVQAAAKWPMLEEIADEFHLEIVGPAVNYCDQCVDIQGTTNDSNPIAYLDAFFVECSGCRIDYIAVHNYMCYTSALQDYMEGFYKYGKKIWLTEFACWDQSTINLTMQKNLVIGAIDYLENDTMVFRYSWFTGGRNGDWPYIDIYGENAGELTELGELYVNFYPVHDTSNFYLIPQRIEAESYSAMLGVQLETTADFDGFANVGYFDGGDWLQYNIDVPETKEYFLYLRISSDANTSIQIMEGEEMLATYTIPSSGGWQNWRNYVQPIYLSKGKHELKLTSNTGNLNVNWIAFTEQENHAPTVIADEDTVVYQPENFIHLYSTAEDQDEDQLTYKWTKVSGRNDIIIETPNQPSTTISGFTNGNYVFELTVSDGIETASDRVKVTVDNRTNFEQFNRNEISIYPNPTNGKLYFDYLKDNGKINTVKIWNSEGRLMIHRKDIDENTSLEFDLSNFKNGIYLVEINADQFNFRQNILLQKE